MTEAKVGVAPYISEERQRELFNFVKKLDVELTDYNLLNLAFTHRSYAHECAIVTDNNERLEFLGDSVLGLSVSNWLFLNLPSKHEGFFSRIKSAVVSEDSLYQVALKLEVGKVVLVGKGEGHSGGRTKKAILSDCMEAIFGCVYLDQGFDVARNLIVRLMEPQIAAFLEHKIIRDYKTAIQEYSQKTWKKVPIYALDKTIGPDHDRTFYVNVSLNGVSFGPAGGKNKKNAQQAAAKLACEQLEENGVDFDC
jgi:ribonuclease-3